MLKANFTEVGPLFEMNVNLDVESAPADTREQERSLIHNDLVGSESWVQVVGDRLNVLVGLLVVVVQANEHGPSVVVDVAGLDLLAVLDFLVGVTEGETDRDFVASPLTQLDEHLLCLFVLLSEHALDLSLQVEINSGHEKLVEVFTAERTGHTLVLDLLLAREAEQVLAGSHDWLGDELTADRALVFLTLSC